jgi:hypothetical protein
MTLGNSSLLRCKQCLVVNCYQYFYGDYYLHLLCFDCLSLKMKHRLLSTSRRCVITPSTRNIISIALRNGDLVFINLICRHLLGRLIRPLKKRLTSQDNASAEKIGTHAHVPSGIPTYDLCHFSYAHTAIF